MFEQIRTILDTLSGFLTGANRKRLQRIGGILILIGLSLMLLSALIKP